MGLLSLAVPVGLPHQPGRPNLGPMIACAIFLLLLATAASGFSDRPKLTMALYFASWISIALLFVHHATEPLDISL